MEKSTENLSKFLQCGIAVLSLVLVLGAAIKFTPQIVTVSSSKNGKELPIYCVDKGENPQISLSFDAAWGDGWLMEVR